MKRILQLLFVSAIAFSCAEQELETSAPNFTSEDATVTLILDDIPEGYEGDSVYVFTRNNEGEVYALTSGTATDGATIAVVPTPGGAPFTLVAYITTDEDWIEKLAEMTTLPTSPKFSDGYYSVSGNLSDKSGTYVTSSWGVEVDGPADADAGSLGAVIEVDITNPLNDAQIGKGSIVTISADVDDNINSGVASVDFRLDGTSIDVVEEAPYSINWNTIDVAAGEHVISVVATNNDGNVAEDEIEVLITTTENEAPSVSFSLSYIGNGDGAGSITNLEVVERQELVDFNISASDDTGIDRVELYIDGTEVATGAGEGSTSVAFDYDWDTFDNATGDVVIEARAFDVSGAQRSAFLNVTLIDPANFIPRATLTSPSSGASFTTADPITFTATVSDAEGGTGNEDTVDGVYFYRVDENNNTNFITSVFTDPYTSDATIGTEGEYEIFARVYDNSGRYTESGRRTITINP